MNNKLKRYWLFSVIGLAAASFYPLYMGARVIGDMMKDGRVIKENYPKYIIPYTPLAIALILGAILLPLFIKTMKRYAFFGGAALSAVTFFAAELLLENRVVVASAETVAKLEDWQMFMCYVPPEGWGTVTEYKTHTPVEILMGEYSPAFKLHFYLISIVLILAVLNCLYGFAQMTVTGDKSRKKALILQSVCAAAFLGLCILACFTAFWRDGNITVSPLSAGLMSCFFILLGVTVGIFFGSLLLKKKRNVLLWGSSIISAATTLLMYVGEMILLNGHLYRFGTGFFFEGLKGIVLAPADILVILSSGAAAYFLMLAAGGKE